MKTEAYRFFYEHAGWSYHPDTETEAQGRRRCARALAKAESEASAKGYAFEWRPDEECDSSEFSEGDPWGLWVCLMRAPDGGVVGCLGAVDFGLGGEPWGNPYRRVVEAEIALENLP